MVDIDRHPAPKPGAQPSGSGELRFNADALTAAAEQLTESVPRLDRAAAEDRRPDSGDRDVSAALDAFLGALDGTMRAATADQRAFAEHLRGSARAYHDAEQHTAALFEPDRPPADAAAPAAPAGPTDRAVGHHGTRPTDPTPTHHGATAPGAPGASVSDDGGNRR